MTEEELMRRLERLHRHVPVGLADWGHDLLAVVDYLLAHLASSPAPTELAREAELRTQAEDELPADVRLEDVPAAVRKLRFRQKER